MGSRIHELPSQKSFIKRVELRASQMLGAGILNSVHDLNLEEQAEDDEISPDGADNSVRRYKFDVFPYNMLNQQLLAQKLKDTTSIDHKWYELVMMLDKDDSGSLNIAELQVTIMALASMGLITEVVEHQPMDARCKLRKRI